MPVTTTPETIYLLVFNEEIESIEAYTQIGVLTDRLQQLADEETEGQAEYIKMTRLPTPETRWSIVVQKPGSHFSYPLHGWEVIDVDIKSR